MKHIERTLINQLGLHARAAAKFSDQAVRFQSNITLCLGTRCVDAKDILGVMTLGAKVGDTLTIEAEGEDEAHALERLSALIQDRFGESC